jgi:hypothetical protein
MYMACRHIKTNGLRCKSPALRGTRFCYFHSKLHSLGAEPYAKYGPMRLPAPEDPASIQLSIAQITDALISGRIEPKRAGQLLYAMQIASQHIESKESFNEARTVQSTEQTADGDELAPEERICECTDECKGCKYADGCPDYDPDDEDDDDEEDDLEVLLKAARAANAKKR